LPYRSVFFDFETHDKEKYQEVCTINYPNNYTFTRITEFKHMTNQESKYTTILSEYPKAYERQDSDNIPLYPVPQVANFGLYQKYLKEADKLKNIYLLGRLADYKYYDMDITIARALEVFNKIIETK
jgi:UDP-galactopyranose mutase